MSLIGPDATPAEIAAIAAEIDSAATVIQQLDYVSVACLAVLVWDWFVCFEEERRLIWTKKIRGSSGYYIFFRVFGFIFQCKAVIVATTRMRNQTYCKADMVMAAVVELILTFTISTMLQARIYAMYDRDRRILILNGSIWLLALGICIGIYAYQLPKQVIVPLPSPLKGCASNAPPLLWTPWVPAIFMELVLCTEVIYKTVKERKWNPDWKMDGDLFTLMVRDYAAWFTASTLVTVTNLLLNLLASSGYQDLALPFYHSLACTTGCHLILNLKAAYHRETLPGAKSTEVVTVTGFEFAAAPANSDGQTTRTDVIGGTASRSETIFNGSR